MPHIDLLELPIFEGIAVANLVSLIDAMPPRQFAAGSVLIEIDEPSPPLYIVTKGELIVQKRGDAGLITLAHLKPPNLVGEVELLAQRPAVARIEAATRVSSFVLERATFASLRQSQHPALLPFVLQLARLACLRLEATVA